jgi:hypothetical protein
VVWFDWAVVILLNFFAYVSKAGSFISFCHGPSGCAAIPFHDSIKNAAFTHKKSSMYFSSHHSPGIYLTLSLPIIMV